MKVKDIMTARPVTCSPDTDLAAAAALMLDGDCGFLPVIVNDKLVGVVTDRDMYIAVATRNRLAGDIKVGEVARRQAFTCGPDDELGTVLATMRQHQVRRLPVEGFGGVVVGVVSMDDILRAVGPKTGLRSDDVVGVLQAICAHHHPTPHVTAA